MSAYCHPAAYAAFARQMRHVDSTQGLFRAACAISLHENPTTDLERAERNIDQLADAVRRRAPSRNEQARIAHLHDLLFDVVGFVGNVEDYYNPANSYVPVVLATRRGLPISLVLIYKCVAEAIGLCVHGINSPGHFLAAVECAEGVSASTRQPSLMYVDPFYGGGLLDEQDVFRRISESAGLSDPPSPQSLSPATHRQWLSRMLINLQVVFAHAGRERDLLAMQELQGLLEP